MSNIKMLSPLSEIAIANRKKYLKSPTWEQIEEWMKLLGVKNKLRIEVFFGMPRSTLSNVKCGQRQLPFEYWHIIYEKVVPQYGVGKLEEYQNKIIREMKIRENRAQKWEEKHKQQELIKKLNSPIQHHRLSKLM